MMQEQVENHGDGWELVLKELRDLHKQIIAHVSANGPDASNAHETLFRTHVLHKYITILALRTAELHKALAERNDIAAFSPEPYTPGYRESILQGLKNLVDLTFQNQAQNLEKLSPAVRAEAEAVLKNKDQIIAVLTEPFRHSIDAMRTRIHGDYHLGQVLFTGDDFMITDFEGEPGRTYAERRYKHSPLRDVAGMIRSFQYAAYASVLLDKNMDESHATLLKPVMQEWYEYVSKIFLEVYLESVGGASILPASDEIRDTLMNSFLLEKAVYELNYELNNRPDWAVIPLRGIQSILQHMQPVTE
jgi:maltose alpha-D-glucosyltransferase / alpha-amylase